MKRLTLSIGLASDRQGQGDAQAAKQYAGRNCGVGTPLGWMIESAFFPVLP